MEASSWAAVEFDTAVKVAVADVEAVELAAAVVAVAAVAVQQTDPLMT